MLGREVIGAGHRHGLGDRQVQGTEPETERVDHVLEDVAARVIPVEPPVDEAIGVERNMLGLTLKRVPVDMLRVAVGGYLAEPAAVGSVAKVVGLEQCERAHAAVPGRFANLLDTLAAVHLHADLDDAARTLERVLMRRAWPGLNAMVFSW